MINEAIKILEKSPIRNDSSAYKNKLVVNELKELEEIKNIVAQLEENNKTPLKIVILGEVKAGKSTLVNTLTGRKVSYTNVVEATASVQEIEYSDLEEINIIKNDGQIEKINSLAELDKLILKNANNQEYFSKVNKISVKVPTKRLKEITIVDTPGLNTITSANEERTENYILNSDVILWVLNCNHLGQSDVSEKIDLVKKYGKPIIGIVNRIDEAEADIDEIISYVEDEMGHQFTKIFAISAKKAWDGYELKNVEMVKESNVEDLYNFLINNIERNADEIQQDSVKNTVKTQIERDMYRHETIKVKLHEFLLRINKDIKEHEKFAAEMKKIIDDKVNSWLEIEFFKEEKEILKRSANDADLQEKLKKFLDENYIKQLINEAHKTMQEEVANKWSIYLEKFIKNINEDKEFNLNNNVNLLYNAESLNSSGEIGNGAVGGAIAGGAAGVAMAGYSTLVGSSVGITFGSAVGAFVPPLLIIGAIGGGIAAYINSQKNNTKKLLKIEEMEQNLKRSIKNDTLNNLKNSLYETNKHYFAESVKIVNSIIVQCETTTDELKKLENQIDDYIIEEKKFINDIN